MPSLIYHTECNLSFTQLFSQTTDDGAFVSPDLTTAYAGSFVEGGKMAAGRVVNVTGYRFTDDVIVPKLSEPAEDATVYRYSKPRVIWCLIYSRQH